MQPSGTSTLRGMTGYDWGDDFLEMWVRPVLIGVIDRFIICLLFTAYISKCTCSIYLYDIISCIDINLYRIYIYMYTQLIQQCFAGWVLVTMS